MAIIEIITSDKNRCGSCKFFIQEENDWFCGNCTSEKTKVKDKKRFYTSKKCAYKEMKKG
jgi:Zn finger protein HypA/HybF involved in hydrogenase expression